MFKVTAICDRCGKEETQTSSNQHGPFFNEGKEKWGKIELKISQYNYKYFLFCKECRQSFGLIDETAKDSEPKIETIEQKLFDAISEIVANQIPNG